MKNYEVVKKKHSHGGTNYVILKFNDDSVVPYKAIDYKFLDDKGRLATQITGNDMIMGSTLERLIEMIEMHHNVLLEIEKTGLSHWDAVIKLLTIELNKDKEVTQNGMD